MESFPAQLTVTVGPTPQLLAPMWSGLVTAETSLGREVEDGSWILSVDGVQRRVCASPGPLYQTMSLGTSGPDVPDLRTCLGAILHRPIPTRGQPDVVGPGLVQAINEAARLLGAAPGGVFDPAWVIWAPSVGWPLVSLTAPVGSLAPAPGSVLALGEPAVLQAQATLLDDNGSVLTSAAAAGERVSFAARGTAVALTAIGTAEPAAVQTALASWAPATSTNAASGGSNAANSTGPLTISGVVDISGPPRLSVPTSAVITGSSGVQCVLTRVAGRVSAVPVRARAAGIDTLVISGRISAHTEIAYDPEDVPGPETCRP